MKRKRIILASDLHYCESGFYGMSRDEIAENLCNDLKNEYSRDPYSALLLLGDYSLDHWAWNTKGTYLTRGVSDSKLFSERFVGRLAPEGVEVRMIAGNHEQYGEELWQKLTGFKRRDCLVCDDVLFILCDTFGGDLDPSEHSDGTYVGADAQYVSELMSAHPDKKVILCAHWFDMNLESEDFRQLVKNDDRILCLFCGHNHISRVASTGEELGNKPIIYTGNHSYSGEKNPVRCLHGYRELIITETGISSKYIVPAATYVMDKVKFTTEYAEQDEIEIMF